MTTLYLFLAAVLYPIAAFALYHPGLRASGVPILLGLLTGILWPICALSANSNSRVYVLGIVWDVIITLSYLLVPIILGKVHMENFQWFGVSLVVTGLILLR